MQSMSGMRGIADVGQELAHVERLRLSGQAAAAEQHCRRILASYGRSAAVLNALSLLVADRGAKGEAESLMRRAIELMPKEPALRNNLGQLLYAQGDLPGAEAAYRMAIRLKSDYAEAFYNLGVVLNDLDRKEEALAAHRRAAAIRPTYVQTLVQIGALLHQRGDNADALEVLDKAVAADHNNFATQYYRGSVLSALKRHADAAAALTTALRLQPRRFEVHFALGNALVAAGQDAQALDAYRRAIELAPDYLPAHEAFNELAWTMGQDIRQQPSYVFARARLGDTPDLLLAEAELRLKFKQAAEAEGLLRRALQTGNQRADVANALGRALALQSRSDESSEQLQQAIDLEPDVIRHRQELAVVLFNNGRFEEGRRILRDALALAPLDQASLAYMSLVCRELGDSEFVRLVDTENLVRAFELPLPAGFADAAAFNAALAEELERLHTRRMEPTNQTLRNGTQTAGSLFGTDNRMIALLQDSIRAVVHDYIRTLPDDANHPFLSRKSEAFSFAGSWSCRLRSSGFHTNHIHNEGWISSAYYVALPDAIHEGDAGWIKFGESRFLLGDNDRPLRTIQPAVGKLVLFPSYYWHGTVPFTSQDRRLTVAFDVVPGTTVPAVYRPY